MTWRVHAENLIGWGLMGYRLYVSRRNFDGSYSVMHNVQFHDYQANQIASIDEFFISDERPSQDTKAFLQAMADAAWEIGIKPKQLENNQNELTAVRYHLEDMRQLAGVKK